MVKIRGKYRSFLDISACSVTELVWIIELARKIKSSSEVYRSAMSGMVAGVLFMKNSTRTRVSFEVGIRKLGATPIILQAKDTQLSRGESVSDTAKVLSLYMDMIAIRCFEQSFLKVFDNNASIPIINALSDDSHPCQIMADIVTYEEKRGSISSALVCWVGNCNNNVLNSWIHAAEILYFELIICSPDDPSQFVRNFKNLKKVKWNPDICEAVKFANVVVTDSWISMGEDETKTRDMKQKMANYSVTAEVMSMGPKGMLFMHCLPAHRGEEVTDSVIDSGVSCVFDQALNRLYAQQAIMLWCLYRM